MHVVGPQAQVEAKAEGLLPKEWVDTWHSPGVQIPLMMSVVGSPLAVEAGTEEVTAAMEGEVDAPIEETLVVRGGQCLIENFQKPSEINAAGLLEGASVNSKAGVSIEELSRGIPNGQIGITTVSKIEAAGGTVKPPRAEIIRTMRIWEGLPPKKHTNFYSYNEEPQ